MENKEQNNEILHQDKFEKRMYHDILEFSFSDLLKYAKDDYGIFEELYYNRDHEFSDFAETAKKLHLSGNNLLVIGSAGIGKSNYVYRLFYNSEMLEESRLFPLMFDFRVITPQNIEGWKLHFIDGFEKYFNYGVIDYRLNLKENIKSNIDDNLFIIQKHLLEVPLSKIQNTQYYLLTI